MSIMRKNKDEPKTKLVEPLEAFIHSTVKPTSCEIIKLEQNGPMKNIILDLFPLSKNELLMKML